MQVAQDKVVLIHYTLTNDAGEVLDSSDGGEPLAYLHGQGNIVAGLEKALDGRTTGEKLSVRVEPAEGLGVRNAELVKRVPRRSFGAVGSTKPGVHMQTQLLRVQMRVVTVTVVKGHLVTVDVNL